MNIADQIDFYRRASMVRRYHQHFLHEPDTVGKHSFGVAMFCHLIDPECRKEVILAALTHDLGELMLGDIPAPTKRALPMGARDLLADIEDKALRNHDFQFCALLSDHESLLLKFADLFDGLAYTTEEVLRGNRTLHTVGETYSRYIVEHLNRSVACPWYEAARGIATTLFNNWKAAQ